jgi:ribosomal protein S18 acetylase RimI-like enzyme
MNSVEEAAADFVTPIPFAKSMVSQVQGLYCGNEDWSHEATRWIQGHGAPSFRTTLNQGGSVWIYENAVQEVVGFGSLSLTEWIIGGSSLTVQYIPMLGVFYEFQGHPTVGTGVPKYCYQIIDHVLDVATERADQYSTVGLAVMPDNMEAIHIYEKSGFSWIKTSDGYNRMFLRLS